MNRRKSAFYYVLLALWVTTPSGCCAAFKAYVKADRKKYEATVPYVLRKVEEDEKAGKLSSVQASIKRKSMEAWKARINAELAHFGEEPLK